VRRLLEHNSVVLAISAGILVVVAVIFLVLWIRARSRLRFETAERINAERDRLDVDVELQEQLGRLRIVRELHEVAVHSVSVIIDQADGAQYAAETDPTAAVRSAAVIAEAARSTLADLRRVMTVVGGGEAVAASIPQLQTTQDLFTVMGDSGLNMTLVEMGERFELRPGAELAIFRILQEALSNALTYGGEGTSVKVTSTWTEEGLQLLVDDDGIATSARRSGVDPNKSAQERTYTFEDDLHALTAVVVGPGISEMRERAALFGGILNAYTVPGVGFSVSAVFPALRYNNGVHGVNLNAQA
jgi:signal transduction histidine kinase